MDRNQLGYKIKQIYIKILILFLMPFFSFALYANEIITCNSLFSEKTYQLSNTDITTFNDLSLSGRSYSPRHPKNDIGKVYEKSHESMNLNLETERLRAIKFDSSLDRKSLLKQMESKSMTGFYGTDSVDEYYEEIRNNVYHWSPALTLAESEFSSVLRPYYNMIINREVRLLELKQENNERIIIGLILVSVFSHEPEIAHTGIMIFDEFQRQGFAKEINISLIQQLRTIKDLTLNVSTVASSNKASLNLFYNLGFQPVDNLIRDEKEMLILTLPLKD